MNIWKYKHTNESANTRGGPHKSEYEQAIIRLVLVAGASVYYLILNYEEIYTGGVFAFGLVFGATYFLLSLLIFSHVSLSEDIHPRFHTRCMVLDVSVTSVAMFLLSGYGVVLLTFYLWLTVGNGFRYGHRELILCALLSLAGFLTMIMFTPYWRDHGVITITGIILLTVIPVYVALMLRRFEELRCRLEAASDEKSRFLANISHEIRTPLNAIILSNHILKDEMDISKKAVIIRDIAESGETMRSLVNTVLDFSRLESGVVELKMAEFNIYDLVMSVESVIRQNVDRKGLAYTLDLDILTPPELWGDRENIRQIIVNLVTNAVKFTEKGGVVFSVKPIVLENDTVQMRFEVKDTGIGISKNEQKRIFDRFRQVDDSTSRRYGGTGLGTAISKQLVEEMGGEIGVESEPGKGSLFWFTLPLEINRKNIDDAAAEDRVHAIIITDGQDGMSSVREKIESLDWQDVSLFPSIEAAVEMLRSQQVVVKYPACMLAAEDDVSGKVDLLNEIRTNMNIPVICFEGKGRAERFRHGHGYNVFASRYHKSLVSNMRNLCKVFSENTYDASTGELRTNLKSSGSNYPDTAIHALVADDCEINRRVLQRLLDRYKVQSTIVDNGYDALKALMKGGYNLALIDIQMPDITGIDVIREYLISLDTQSPIPIAVLTGDATVETREQCEKYNIRHFLTKPVNPLQLRDLVYEMAPSG